MDALKIATTVMREGQLAWHLFRDPRVPTLAKFIPVLALLYVLLPIDIIPDWLPVIGGVDDIAIVSIDNIAESAYCRPPLTTVHIPKREMGVLAFQRLHHLITSGNDIPVKNIVYSELVVRESSGTDRSTAEP